jgi:hypothetical protein
MELLSQAHAGETASPNSVTSGLRSALQRDHSQRRSSSASAPSTSKGPFPTLFRCLGFQDRQSTETRADIGRNYVRHWKELTLSRGCRELVLVLGKQSGNLFGRSMAAFILAVIRVIASHAFGFIILALLMSARRQVKLGLNSTRPIATNRAIPDSEPPSLNRPFRQLQGHIRCCTGPTSREDRDISCFQL